MAEEKVVTEGRSVSSSSYPSMNVLGGWETCKGKRAGTRVPMNLEDAFLLKKGQFQDGT